MAYLARCCQSWHARAMAPNSKLSSMNVSLPREQKSYVDQRVASGHFGSTSDYVRELIRRDQRDVERNEIELRLLAALESPRREMTAADWKQFRKALVQRHARRKQG